jgi:hypothetical protein
MIHTELMVSPRRAMRALTLLWSETPPIPLYSSVLVVFRFVFLKNKSLLRADGLHTMVAAHLHLGKTVNTNRPNAPIKVDKTDW